MNCRLVVILSVAFLTSFLWCGCASFGESLAIKTVNYRKLDDYRLIFISYGLTEEIREDGIQDKAEVISNGIEHGVIVLGSFELEEKMPNTIVPLPGYGAFAIPNDQMRVQTVTLALYYQDEPIDFKRLHRMIRDR